MASQELHMARGELFAARLHPFMCCNILSNPSNLSSEMVCSSLRVKSDCQWSPRGCNGFICYIQISESTLQQHYSHVHLPTAYYTHLDYHNHLPCLSLLFSVATCTTPLWLAQCQCRGRYAIGFPLMLSAVTLHTTRYRTAHSTILHNLLKSGKPTTSCGHCNKLRPTYTFTQTA